MELQVNLAGIHLEHPLMNAAGTCKLLNGSEGVRELARSNTAAIMVGTITLERREGNSGEVYWTNEMFSLNSLGWPNPGRLYYQQHLPTMAVLSHNAGKPLFVNVGGFSPDEYATLTEFAFERGADLVELDLSCSSIWEEGQQKRIPCFDPRLVEEILRCVEEKVGVETKVAVKLSPFSDSFALGEVAQVIGQSKVVKVVTTVNTFPNAFSYDERGKPRITPGGGLAGLGGPALKPIGLGQVKQLRSMLPEHIDIVGVGGITTGQDILDYQRAGAVAVQTATALLGRRLKVFSQLLSELISIVSN